MCLLRLAKARLKHNNNTERRQQKHQNSNPDNKWSSAYVWHTLKIFLSLLWEHTTPQRKVCWLTSPTFQLTVAENVTLSLSIYLCPRTFQQLLQDRGTFTAASKCQLRKSPAGCPSPCFYVHLLKNKSFHSQKSFYAHLKWFLTCVKKSSWANWEMETHLLSKLWHSEHWTHVSAVSADILPVSP